MSDPQDQAEQLDSDKLGTADDLDVEPDYPADQLMGADQYGITAAEERHDEPLEERLEREIPDPLATELEREVAREGEDLQGASLEAELDRVEQELDSETRDAVDAAAFDGAAAGSAAVGSGGAGLDLDAPLEGEEVGRLVEPGTDEDATDFIDEEADSIGQSSPANDLSAEEAAMHVTDDPPMGQRGGGYVP